MKTLKDVQAGDTVLLTDVNTGRTGKGPKEVTVAKTGRKLIHIARYEGKPELGTLTYRIDTGVRNDNYSHSRIRTRDEYENAQRHTAALQELRELGMEPTGTGQKFSADTIEAVIAVLKKTK